MHAINILNQRYVYVNTEKLIYSRKILHQYDSCLIAYLSFQAT